MKLSKTRSESISVIFWLQVAKQFHLASVAARRFLLIGENRAAGMGLAAISMRTWK